MIPIVSNKHCPAGTAYRNLSFAAIILLSGFVLLTLMVPSVGYDSGFYLKIALDLFSGLSFYQDMLVAYNPLAMYLFSLVFYLFPGGGVFWFYLLCLVLLGLNSFLLYTFMGYFHIGKTEKRFLSLIFLLSYFLLDGTSVLLEPVVLFFQLCALLIVIKALKTGRGILFFVAAGFSVFLAFYSKQYGLSVLPALIWLLYFNNKSLRHFAVQVAALFAGMVFPAVVIVCWYNRVEISGSGMAGRLSGMVYLTGNDQVTGIGYNFLLFLESAGRFIAEIPVVILVFYAAFRKESRKIFLEDKAILLILLIAGASLQLLFAGYRHYYQLILPFILVLTGYFIQRSGETSMANRRLLIILSAAFLLISTYFLVRTSTDRVHTFRQQQTNVPVLQQHLPPGEKVYLQAISPAYYYLCRYDSPDHLRLSYRFPIELSPEFVSRNMPSKAYIVLDQEYLGSGCFDEGFTFVNQLYLHELTCYLFQKD